MQYSLLAIIFSYIFAEMKRLFFEKVALRLGITGGHYSCHPIVDSFSDQMNLKNKTQLHFFKPTKKRKSFDIWTSHVTMTQRERISLHGIVN